MLHSEIGSSANADMFRQCWEIMDRLERALLDLANIVSEEMVPLGESTLLNWSNACQRLSQLYNELTAPPFDVCDISDSVYTERDRYFDDCSCSSLVLVAGIEAPAQTMYLSQGGIPFEAQNVLDRLEYLVNEMRLNGNIDERTRGLVITILSDTAKVVMKGPKEASLDFWNEATMYDSEE
ncbi:hypothetical protein FS837_005011 [Tulasnella sp. UAMH 9824]|nr:hypothetical protein FS837_005011 [Tulasnella sp. UAMH 9824]